jgi:hypothetical protein
MFIPTKGARKILTAENMVNIPYSEFDKYLVSIGKRRNGIDAFNKLDTVYTPEVRSNDDFAIFPNCII